MLKKIVCLLVVCALVYGEEKLTSPCPGKFDYIASNATGGWDGFLSLNSEYTLHGLWIRVFFDHPIKSISSPDNLVDVHDVHTDLDKNSFLLKNREYVLKKNTPLKVQFHVQYEGDKKPLLTRYRLNAREVCLPESD